MRSARRETYCASSSRRNGGVREPELEPARPVDRFCCPSFLSPSSTGEGLPLEASRIRSSSRDVDALLATSRESASDRSPFRVIRRARSCLLRASSLEATPLSGVNELDAPMASSDGKSSWPLDDMLTIMQQCSERACSVAFAAAVLVVWLGRRILADQYTGMDQ